MDGGFADSGSDDHEVPSDEFVELHPTREDLGTRLDRYVADQLPDLSRGTVQRLIESGNVRVDNQQRKPKFRMTPGEVVSVEIPPPGIDEILPDPIPLNIVFEDADVIVVDKPAGMVVHPRQDTCEERSRTRFWRMYLASQLAVRSDRGSSTGSTK